MTRQKVLGVDTSLRGTGVGVVEQTGSAQRAVTWGVIRNPAKRPHTACLAHIHRELQQLIATEKPDAVAVEGVFFSKNVRTAVTLGQARGVVLAVCSLADVPVYEYAPRTVKQAVVGHGNAHKEQIIKMVSLLLGLKDAPAEDAADALALAIAHLQQNRLGLPGGKAL